MAQRVDDPNVLLKDASGFHVTSWLKDGHKNMKKN
jgi:hypothetical protein